MNPELQQIIDLTVHYKWWALATLVIGLIVRLLKDDTKLPTFPAKWRSLLAIFLGIVAGVIDKIASGTSYKHAMLGGLIASFVSIVGHDVFIEGIRNGKEIPLPRALLDKSNLVPPPIAEPESQKDKDQGESNESK